MKHYLWAIAWAILVLFLISSPIHEGSLTSHFFYGIDKLVHTGFFFVFTILMLFGSLMNNDKPSLFHWSSILTLVIGSFFAISTELIQKYLFTYRDFEYWDIFADHVGIAMGYFAYLVLVLSISKIKG